MCNAFFNSAIVTNVNAHIKDICYNQFDWNNPYDKIENNVALQIFQNIEQRVLSVLSVCLHNQINYSNKIKKDVLFLFNERK